MTAPHETHPAAQVVLELDSLLPREPGERAVYIQTQAAPTAARQRLDMPAADFRALGEPERITVTIQAGDRLGEEMSD